MKLGNIHRNFITLVAVTACASAARAQITTNAKDGVLNAPYRGTINSLREATMDIGYGEVMNHAEPRSSGLSLNASQNIEIWLISPTQWDRSVLRMYQELDASGPEIDLTGDTAASPDTTVSSGTGGIKRFSFRAMGTKSLASQSFQIG